MTSQLMDDFNKLVVEHDYNPLKRLIKTFSIQDPEVSNDQLLHNVLFECFDQSVENQSKAWENPQKVCNVSEIERPFYQKNMQKLPDPVSNDVLSFIDSKYWAPSDIRSRDDRKAELKNKNVSISGWNYNERDISDIINCFNTIKKIKKENILLFINFENVLEYTLKLSNVIKEKNCLSEEEKEQLKFNSTIQDLTSMNHTVNKMVEQLEHLKEKNEVAIITQSELAIKKMIDEINFFRKRYKKNEDYVLERDHINYENFSAFLFSDPVHKYQIGMQNPDNYYYPDTQPNSFQLQNALYVKKMEDEYNVMMHLNEFIRKNLTTKKDDPEKSKDDIIKDICSEYSDIFQAIIEHSHLKSKLEYLSYYKNSFLHINALTTIHNLSKKNIREICESPLDMKTIEAQISVNFEKVNQQINQYSALFETMELKYPIGFVADLLISSFFKGLNYERSFNEKFKDLSPEGVVLKSLKQLTREKDLPLYIFNDGYKQTMINARLDSMLLNKRSTVQYNSVFFGFNSHYNTKENILNDVFSSQLKGIHAQFLQSTPTYDACFEYLKQKTGDCDFTTIFKDTNKMVQNAKKGCLSDKNMYIFYYITFFILDTLCNCNDLYVSPFHSSFDNSTKFNDRKANAQDYLHKVNAIQLYDSFQGNADEKRTQVLQLVVGFSVQLYNVLFNFDDQYYFVCMNSFFKCFIPALLSISNKIDETKTENYECFFETNIEFRKLSNLSIEDQWCLKGIKIDDCTGKEETYLDEFDIVDTQEKQNTLLSKLNDLIVDVSAFLDTSSSDELDELLQEITELRDFNSIFLYLGLHSEIDEETLKQSVKEFTDRFEGLKLQSTQKDVKAVSNEEPHDEAHDSTDEEKTDDVEKEDVQIPVQSETAVPKISAVQQTDNLSKSLQKHEITRDEEMDESIERLKTQPLQIPVQSETTSDDEDEMDDESILENVDQTDNFSKKVSRRKKDNESTDSKKSRRNLPVPPMTPLPKFLGLPKVVAAEVGRRLNWSDVLKEQFAKSGINGRKILDESEEEWRQKIGLIKDPEFPRVEMDRAISVLVELKAERKEAERKEMFLSQKNIAIPLTMNWT
jgi:hypothetical protein